MIRRFAAAVIAVLGLLTLMAENEDREPRLTELAQQHEVYSWRSK